MRWAPGEAVNRWGMSMRSKKSVIPNGAWPRRMNVALAAAYVGEERVDEFLRRIGREYPRPRIDEGSRKLWLKDDLDRAIDPESYDFDAADLL